MEVMFAVTVSERLAPVSHGMSRGGHTLEASEVGSFGNYLPPFYQLDLFKELFMQCGSWQVKQTNRTCWSVESSGESGCGCLECRSHRH